MPDEFKKLRRGTDAPTMSDTATPGTATPGSFDTFLLDGEMPRLGDAPVLPPPAPIVQAESPRMMPAPDSMPALSMPEPALPAPSLPTPTAAPTAHGAAPAAADGSEPSHPMAHLMGGANQKSEAATWATELRAAKKRKAKRNKIIAAAVFVAIAAVVGPPLGKWLAAAVNEAGSTKSDEPAATTVPADSAPAASTPVATAPVSTVGGALGVVVDAPNQAEAVVADVNADANANVAVANSIVAPATTVAP
jgi:hypothetical protein